MSKLSSYERFFLGRIGVGFDNLGWDIKGEDIEKLLGSPLNIDEAFNASIKSALVSAYSEDVDKFKRKLVTESPTAFWQESVKKLYKGRETLLRDIVVEWYSKYSEPGFFEKLKRLFRKD